MIARRSVWSDERVARLLGSFVPVADEVGRLQRGEDIECRFFQAFAEQGHYGGRTEPSNTRQGIYAVAPSGKFLASINTRRADDVVEMLERALAAWKELPRDERLRATDPATEVGAARRYEARFPEGGVALRVTTRDLPRETPVEGRSRDWRRAAWNVDWAWLRREELRALCAPEPMPAVGATWTAPTALARRIARAQLVDFVRGQTPAFKDEDVERAELRATLVSIDDGVANLRFEGTSRTNATGHWKIDGFEPTAEPQTRGLELDWLGFARWHIAEERVVELELLLTGTRWGATQFNGRADDLDAAPIGFVFELVDLAPEDRVAPAQIWSYGW